MTVSDLDVIPIVVSSDAMSEILRGVPNDGWATCRVDVMNGIASVVSTDTVGGNNAATEGIVGISTTYADCIANTCAVEAIVGMVSSYTGDSDIPNKLTVEPIAGSNNDTGPGVRVGVYSAVVEAMMGSARLSDPVTEGSNNRTVEPITGNVTL